MEPSNWATLRRSALGGARRSEFAPALVTDLVRALSFFPQRDGPAEFEVRAVANIVDSNPQLRSEFFWQRQFAIDDRHCETDSTIDVLEKLGIENSRLLLISSGIQSSKLLTKSTLINGRAFWAANHERALIAAEVARTLGANEWTSFIGARVEDFLLPHLFSRFQRDYVDFLKSGQPLRDFERTRFGQDHAELAACALFDWGCPDELICCVLMHHRGCDILDDEMLGKSSAAAVAVASMFPDPLKQVPRGLSQLFALQDRFSNLDLFEIAEKVDRRFHETEKRRVNHISLLRRINHGRKLAPARR